MPGNSPDAGAGWLPGLAPRRMRLRGVASVAQLGRTFNARRRPGRGGTDQRSASTVIATRQWCLQPRAHAAAPSAGRARAPPSIGGTAVRVAERAPCSPPVRPALNPARTAAGARHELPSCKPRRRLGTGFGRETSHFRRVAVEVYGAHGATARPFMRQGVQRLACLTGATRGTWSRRTWPQKSPAAPLASAAPPGRRRFVPLRKDFNMRLIRRPVAGGVQSVEAAKMDARPDGPGAAHPSRTGRAGLKSPWMQRLALEVRPRAARQGCPLLHLARLKASPPLMAHPPSGARLRVIGQG